MNFFRRARPPQTGDFVFQELPAPLPKCRVPVPEPTPPTKRVTLADLIPQSDWEMKKLKEENALLKAKEQTVRDYLANQVDGQLGTGDDPIGFLIASHAAHVASLKRVKAAREVGEGGRATGEGYSGEAARNLSFVQESTTGGHRSVRGTRHSGCDWTTRDHWMVKFPASHPTHPGWQTVSNGTAARYFIAGTPVRLVTTIEAAQINDAAVAVGVRAPGNDQKPAPGTG